MTSNPMMGEATATLPDGELRLAMNNRAWVQVERVIDMSYLDAIGYLLECEIANRSPKLGVTGGILWGATRAHHDALTLDQCYDLVADHGEAVLGPLGAAIRGSIKLKEPDEGEAKPAEGPAKAKAGTGTTR